MDALLARYTVDPIARQVGYLFNYKSKCDELKAQLEKLKDAREDVQRRIDDAERNGDDIEADVESWLTEAKETISAGVQLLVEDEEKAKKRFKSHYKFSKKAVKANKFIAELLRKKGLFERVSCGPAPKGMAPVRGYEEFESRTGAFNGVMEALKDSNLSIIGVYGTGGVGKTTLVKQVARQAKEKKLFDYVVMAAVTQTPNMLNVQSKIAEKLGIDVHYMDVSVRAGRLRERLEEEKSNVLIILDDICSPLNLDELGVPSGDQDMGCKILMTSRRLDLLQSMGSQKNLAIEILTQEEAWNLFQNMAGEIVGRREIQPTAVEIAKKCAGLPIAIVPVAKALKHKGESFQWKYALEKLNKPSKDDDVHKAITLSYTFLEEEVQKIFLLCSIMGHNAAIEDLLIYCRGYGLFRDLDTIQKGRDRVLTLVSDLKDSSLLLSSSTPGCFDMHDVVRDVAVSIASMNHHWLSLEKVDVSEDLSNEEIMQDSNLISLQHAQVSGLPDELECLNLTFLSMGMSSVNRSFFSFYDKRSSLKIPNNFLKGMQKLKALSFAKVQFSSLPFSADFHLLKTLRTLYLFGCELDDISIIGELTNLEILNLRESRFEMLPREIAQLRNLKLVDLSGCRDLEVIPPNVLSGLSRLEELYVYDSFDSWEVVDEGRESPVGSNASLVELKNLSHLTILEVHVPNVKAIPKDTKFFGKLERYKISIGWKKWHPWRNKQTSRMLMLRERGDKMFDDKLLTKVDNLCLIGVNDVTNLERISYYGELNVESFSQLRVLQISNCERLKNLFSFSIAKEFYQLEEIDVSHCMNITELIAEKREEETLKFDKLNSLKLKNLPKLIRLCGVKKNLSSFEQGRDQSIYSESNVCLFDHKVALPMLQVLEIESMENLERLWPNQFADEESFLKLTQLCLERCHKLLNVFPLSMSRRLQRLETMVIDDCELVEEIFGPPLSIQAQASNIITFEFPQLTKLELLHLPNLKSFYHQPHTINLPSMKKELRVYGCDKVEILFATSFPAKTGKKKQQEIPVQLPLFCLNELSFTNLKEVSMKWNDGMEEICHDTQLLASQYFCSLEVVRIESFPKEMDIFPSKLFQFLISLPNLQHLEINYAYFKQILVEVQENEGVFQNLKNLQVRLCPNLKDNLVPSSLSFQNLVALEVGSCGGIIKLVTYWTAKSLVQLQEMRINSCFEIEEIIEGNKDDDEDGEVKDELLDFPRLKLLELNDLPNIESFCSSRNYTFQFQSLQTVIVEGCPKMKMFSQGNSYTPMLHKVYLGSVEDEECWSGSLNSTIKEMFKEMKSKEDEHNPSTLEQLYLTWNSEMKEIWHSYYCPLQLLPSKYLCTLKVVTIESFPEIISLASHHQLFQFLISLPNLQSLEIFDVVFKEMFQSPSSALEDQVPEWRLESSISVEQPCHDGVPQISSFALLTTLRVSSCSNLKHLFPSSMVKSFVQLKTLDVRNCEGMEQLIILNEGLVDEEWNNIMVFPQLDSLNLIRLPNLKRFCFGNRIEFPSLRKLEIEDCSALGTFKEVQKNISTENSQANVPQYLFNEREVLFQNLVTLEVHLCHGIKKLVTHWTAKSLVQLQEMRINSCNEIEEIIEGSGDDDDGEVKDEIHFPQLKLLELNDLPNLESFCSSGNYYFQFPFLQTVIVEDCPKMKMFSQRDSYTPMLLKVNLDSVEDEPWSGSLNSTIQEMFKEKKSKEDEHNPSTLEQLTLTRKSKMKEIRPKVLKETQGRILRTGDGEAASQSSSTHISGNELQLKVRRDDKNPAEEGAVSEHSELSGKLEKPSVDSYGSKEFPMWLEVSSILKLTFLCISDNNNCASLPPLGQLPSLEHLIIQRLGGVRSIGPEFYLLRLPFQKPFQSLKTLKFEAMSQWEHWTTLEEEGEEFPCLQEFYMLDCPKLEGDLPKRLPSLIKLEISECQRLAASLPWTPEHCELKLNNCDKVRKRSNVSPTVAPQSPTIMCQEEDDVQIVAPLSPSKMRQEQDEVRTVSPPSPSIMHEEQDDIQRAPSSSFGVTELTRELQTDSHSLRIERCALDRLPKEILERSSLQHLYLIDCLSLKTFPQSPSLKTLYIQNCKNLEFPHQPNKVMNQDADLEDLCLGSSCDSLTNFPLNYFPKLKALSLWKCGSLECLSIKKEFQNEFSSLEALEIKDCPHLGSFQAEEFQAPNLTSLVFFNCGSLKSLRWIESLTSLQSLYINKCPALESLPVEGFPSSLIILSISFCDKITPHKGWKLDKLHSLSHFEIEGGYKDLKSFPEKGLLPENLNSLRISRFSDLTSLETEGLQMLTSLQTLEINCCDKLDSLPKHGLPSSLSCLSISDCSLLNPKLQNRKGIEWSKIARIPSIHLDEVSD